MATGRLVPFGVRLTIGLTIGTAILWSIGWFVVASEGRHAFEQWRADATARGAILNCTEEHAGGYPFRLRFDCTDPVINIRAGSETHMVTGKALRMVALIYNPDHLIVELDGPIAVVRNDPDPATIASAKSGVARASVKLAGGELQRLSVVLPSFVSLIPAGGGTQAQAGFTDAAIHLRAREEPGAHDLAVNGTGLTLLPPDFDPGDDINVDSLDLIAIVNKVPTTGLDDVTSLLTRWRDSGGVADIRRFSFDSPALAADSKGTIEIGPDGRLEGALTGSFRKLDRFIDALQQRGMISDSEAQLSLGAIGLFGAAPAGRAEVTLPTRIHEGKVYLGPVQVVSLPPLI